MMHNGWKLIVFMAIVLGLAIAAPFAGSYTLSLAAVVCVYALFAVSFDVVYGYGGMLSLGQAMFYGTGAYVAAFVIAGSGVHVGAAILVSVASASLLAAITGAVAVRLRGPSFMILTIIASTIVLLMAQAFPEITGGDDGLIVPAAKLAAAGGPSTSLARFYLALAALTVGFLAAALFVTSPYGRLLQAAKDNPLRAQFLGLNIERFKLVCFIFSGALAGLAGSVNAVIMQHVDAGLFHIFFSVSPLVWTFVGGIGTLVGPVLGAVVLVPMEDYLGSWLGYPRLFAGLLLIAVTLLSTGGLVALFRIRGFR